MKKDTFEENYANRYIWEGRNKMKKLTLDSRNDAEKY